MSMKIVFMGSPEFALPSLRALVQCSDMSVVAVFTQPDSASKRGKKLVPTAVKTVALELGIDVHTPQNLRGEGVHQLIASYSPDAIVVASYGNILPPEVLEIPPLGCINVHASLLPRWRGAAPVERAILAEDSQAGVSIMRMEEGLDTGDFCMQRSVEITNQNASELTSQLADLGAQCIVEALCAIERGEAQWIAQDQNQYCYAQKISKIEMLLDPQFSAHKNALHVRAASEHAPARAIVCGRAMAVLNAQEFNPSLAGFDVQPIAPGEVKRDHKKLLLGCKSGILELNMVKPDGKNQMDAAGFCAGVHDQLKSGKATWEAIR